MNLDLSYIYIKIRQKKICVSMETCDYDVKIPTQGPLATGPSWGRPALTGYACAVPLARSQRWQQVIFCKSKSSHKSFPCKSRSSHKSFPCKSKSSHKSIGQTSSQVTSHLVQTQVKSQVSLSKYKSSRTLFLPLPS